MLLKQLDRYCGCYKTDGHKSLLDCYRSRHGATCQICTNEVFDASRMFDSGMTPEQIKESLRRQYPDQLVACNSDIGIALMYHEACVKESFA